MDITRVLVADDDEAILWVLEKFFKDRGCTVETAADGMKAEAVLGAGRTDLAVLDINMPGKDGLEILKETDTSQVAVIIMTAEGTMKNTLEAMKTGAFDYVTKPFDLDELGLIVDRAVENLKLKEELTRLKEKLHDKWTDETAFVGRSKEVQDMFKTVGRVATKDVTILLAGESGTGKELLANIIHLNGPRSKGPFIAVNSAAVPAELMESELFGHEEGAFTGATRARKGKFELAEGGTLFLDEVGDMGLELQAKLLRALQEKEFFRVGGNKPIKVDVRIIAATNKDLVKAVEEKRFRDDLLYRLNVVRIDLPPLRDRKGDVEVLAEYFLSKFTHDMGVELRWLSKKAVEEMERYPWPGNVRELENVLRRAVLLSQTLQLTPSDLDLPLKGQKKEPIEDMITKKLTPFIEKTDSKGRQELYETIMPFMERPLIKLVLKKTRNNQVRAAELLGINRNTLRKKIKELRINLKEIKE
jgi:two-component system nitrogen regulation response regulator GlnG